MIDALRQLFAERGFVPHGHCLNWNGPLLWTSVVSNLLIGLAYYSIPLAIWSFLKRQRDFRFNWMLMMFGVFIMACGTTHWLDVVNIWVPVYRLDAAVLLVTATASVVTAVLLWPLIPEAVAFIDQRRRIQEKLQETNHQLLRSLEKLDSNSRSLRERERELALTIESAPIGMAVAGLDGGFQIVNQALCAMLGYRREELLGKRFQDITHDEDVAASFDHFYDLLDDEVKHYTLEKRYLSKSGQAIEAQIDVSLLRSEQGKPLRFIVQIQDVSERKRLERALRENNAKLEISLSQIMRRNREITILSELSRTLQYCVSEQEMAVALRSVSGELFAGYTTRLYALEVAGDALVPLKADGADAAIHDFDRAACWAMRSGQLRWSDERDGLHCEHLLDGKCGDVTALCVPMSVQGMAVGLLCLIAQPATADPASLESREPLESLALMTADRIGIALANLRLRNTLRQQSIRDPLTNLHNRRHLDEVLPRELKRAQRDGVPVSLLMIDVDHFKRINDGWGHDFGDQALKLVANTLAGACRGSDLVCRYGGEEFVVLMPEADTANAVAKAEEIRRRVLVAGKELINERDHSLTLSIGVATYPHHAHTAGELLQAADDALYRAKQLGRDQVLMSHASPARPMT